MMAKVVEVELNPVTKKLVVRMEDGFGREGIESLRVMDKDEAVAIDTGWYCVGRPLVPKVL